MEKCDSYPNSLADLAAGRYIFGDALQQSDCEDAKRSVCVGFLRHTPQVPPWYEASKFSVGQRFFHDHLVGVLFAYFSSLLVGFTVPSLAEALLFTAVSDGAGKSLKRYLDTLVHIVLWHDGDVFDPKSTAWKSLDLVARMHQSVRKGLERRQTLRVEERKTSVEEAEVMENSDSEPSFCRSMQFLSQYDMALVQSGFIGPVILYPCKLGIGADSFSLECYVYFWRVIGYCLGISDRFNVCSGGLGAAQEICAEIEQSIIVPSLRVPSPEYQKLSGDFVEGVTQINPAFRGPVMEAYIYASLGLDPPSLTFREWLQLIMLKLGFWLSYYCGWWARWSNHRIKKYIDIFCDRMMAKHPELQ